MRTTWRLSLTMMACSAVLLLANHAGAVLLIANGGFDAQDASVNNNATVTPTGWFNASNEVNTFSDNILNVQRGANGAISNAAGAAVGMWDANGLALGRDAPFGNDGTLELAYVYQSLGAYSGEASLSINGFVYNRTNGNQPGNFNVAYYYTSPGAFTPAVGTDIANAATLIGTQQVFTQGVDFTITTGTVAQSASWTHTENFAGSGITNGSEVWLRFGDGGNPDFLLFDEPIIDNVRLAACALGDADCNGVSNPADLTAIRNNFRKSTGVTRAMGDLDGSGDVDMLDYMQWRRAQPPGGGSVGITSAGGVPEPSTVLLGGLAAMLVASLRRSRSVK